MTTPQKETPEREGFSEPGKLSVADAAQADGRRDWLTGPQSGPADGDTVGGFGDLKNDQTTHWKVQER